MSKAFLFLAIFGASLQAIAFANGLALDLLSALLFVLFYYSGHKLTIRRVDRWLLLWLFVIVMGGVGGLLLSDEFDISRYLSHTIRLVVYFLFFMAVRDMLISEPRMLPYVQKLILALGLLQSLYGVYQFIGFKYGLPLTDLRILQADKPVIREFNEILVERPYGTFREPSNFGNFLIYWMFLCVAVGKLNDSLKKYAVFVVPLLILACMLTLSRGAIASAVLAVLIQVLFELFRGRIRYALVSGGVIALVLIIILTASPFLIDYVVPIFTGEGDNSIVTRWSTYSIFLSNMGNWLIGYGLGQFELMYYVYEDVIWGPQSAYVYVISNSGLLGMICYVMVLAGVLKRGAEDDDAIRFLRIALLAGLIHNLSFLGVTTSLHWLVLAVVFAFASRRSQISMSDISIRKAVSGAS